MRDNILTYMSVYSLQDIENINISTLREVVDVIARMKSNKALGNDQITVELVKNGGTNLLLSIHKHGRLAR